MGGLQTKYQLDLRVFATQTMEVKGWFGTMNRGARFHKRRKLLYGFMHLSQRVFDGVLL